VHILQAVKDHKVFGSHFKGDTWAAWTVFLAVLFALPMTSEQLALYQRHTGRNTSPTTPFLEAWLVCGRRAGKSFMLALVAVFLACFKDWRAHLGPGEVGTIAVVCADRRQARTIMRFALGLLKATPMLKRQVINVTKESITLRNDIVIEIHTASFRTVRGYTIVAALLDEIAFWPTDETASEPDVEVLAAVKPAMATVPGAMLLCASSPYSRRGVLWDAHRKHFGKDGDPVLVWQAPTRAMNPSVSEDFIRQHLEDDPARAAAEYLAQFRTDIEGFVSREVVLARVDPCVFERAKEHYKVYQAFCDPSGGSSDSMTLAIAHKDVETKRMILDCIREVRPPFSPAEVCREFATVCKSYGVSKIVGDRYAGEWPVEQFVRFGITYEQSARPKSELYIDLLAAINSGRVVLLDNARLINQLVGLERRVARSGKDSIDHSPGGHDDVANSVAGVFAAVIGKYPGYDSQYLAWCQDDPSPAVDGLSGADPRLNNFYRSDYYDRLRAEAWERFAEYQRNSRP
jgi:hypothetical protein